jgi:hypothetical protein
MEKLDKTRATVMVVNPNPAKAPWPMGERGGRLMGVSVSDSLVQILEYYCTAQYVNGTYTRL